MSCTDIVVVGFFVLFFSCVYACVHKYIKVHVKARVYLYALRLTWRMHGHGGREAGLELRQ